MTLELRRDQLEECVRFYELLGFTRVEPPPSLADRAAWMQSGATQVHLMWVDSPVALPRGHVAVVIDSYDADATRRGRRGRRDRDEGGVCDAPRAYVGDPAGNLMELMSAPPPAG